jgi:hypothetical protein
MIRNAIFGFSVLALSAGSAFASPVKHHNHKPVVVAEASAPATDTAAPAGEATDKKAKKSTKAGKADKAGKTEGAKSEIKGGSTKSETAKEIKAPAPTAMPEAPIK